MTLLACWKRLSHMRQVLLTQLEYHTSIHENCSFRVLLTSISWHVLLWRWIWLCSNSILTNCSRHSWTPDILFGSAVVSKLICSALNLHVSSLSVNWLTLGCNQGCFWYLSFLQAVHPISNLYDLKRRLGTGRRCFGFFHPAMPGW
jgi:hypothetical protein